MLRGSAVSWEHDAGYQFQTPAARVCFYCLGRAVGHTATASFVFPNLLLVWVLLLHLFLVKKGYLSWSTSQYLAL